MTTRAIVMITKPADLDVDRRILVSFPKALEKEDTGNYVTVPKRLKWFIQNHTGLEAASKWTDGATWIPDEKVEDFGIYVSTETSPNTALLDEISTKYSRGAVSGADAKTVTTSAAIRRVATARNWDIPVLPILGSREETTGLDKRDVYLRPSGEKFYARKFAQGDEVIYLRDCQKDGDPVFLKSVPGTGKTAVIEAAFPELVTMVCSANTERADLIGSYVMVPATTKNPAGFKWVNGPFLEAVLHGQVFYLDEIALADPRVMSIVYSLMDGREFLEVPENPLIGNVPPADGFYVIASTNPDAHGAIISDALLDRFLEHVDVHTDYELATLLGVEARFIEFAKRMEAKRVSGSVSWAPQMRSCLFFNKAANRSGIEHAIRNEMGKCPPIDREIAVEIAKDVFDMTSDMLTPLAIS